MDKVVVITGASGGIGAATADHLASAGASLVLAARREDRLREVAARSARAEPVVADVTRRADVARIVAAAVQRFGRIDVWINNAGQGLTRMPSQLTDEDVDDMIRSNVKSALYGMQEVLPHMAARGSGHIINVSSLLGRMPLAIYRSAYAASKHYLNALTAMFREEVQQTHPGIQVSLVSPGVVYTDFGRNALHGGSDSRAIPGGQTPEEVAAVIGGVIDSRAIDVYTRPGSRQQVVDYYSNLGVDAAS